MHATPNQCNTDVACRLKSNINNQIAKENTQRRSIHDINKELMKQKSENKENISNSPNICSQQQRVYPHSIKTSPLAKKNTRENTTSIINSRPILSTDWDTLEVGKHVNFSILNAMIISPLEHLCGSFLHDQ